MDQYIFWTDLLLTSINSKLTYYGEVYMVNGLIMDEYIFWTDLLLTSINSEPTYYGRVYMVNWPIMDEYIWWTDLLWTSIYSELTYYRRVYIVRLWSLFPHLTLYTGRNIWEHQHTGRTRKKLDFKNRKKRIFCAAFWVKIIFTV